MGTVFAEVRNDEIREGDLLANHSTVTVHRVGPATVFWGERPYELADGEVFIACGDGSPHGFAISRCAAGDTHVVGRPGPDEAWPPSETPTTDRYLPMEHFVAGAISTVAPFDQHHPAYALPHARQAIEAIGEFDPDDADRPAAPTEGYDAWLAAGQARGWVSGGWGWCNAHDQAPMSPEEEEAFEVGAEHCMPTVRLFGPGGPPPGFPDVAR